MHFLFQYLVVMINIHIFLSIENIKLHERLNLFLEYTFKSSKVHFQERFCTRPIFFKLFTFGIGYSTYIFQRTKIVVLGSKLRVKLVLFIRIDLIEYVQNRRGGVVW